MENNNRTTAKIVFLCQASFWGIENMYNKHSNMYVTLLIKVTYGTFYMYATFYQFLLWIEPMTLALIRCTISEATETKGICSWKYMKSE